MKKQLIQTTLAVASLAISFLFPSQPVKAAVLGDDYPIAWKTGGYGVDPWAMYWRQCTSFVAYRLHNTNGYSLPWGYGNAITWGPIARANGYRVDMEPAVGSVAWFSSGVNGAGNYGHVAWVAEVKGEQVTVEEYNFDAGQGPEQYYRRTFHKSQVSGYIHFKDLESQVQPATTAASLPQVLKVGDQIQFKGPFRVSSIIRTHITSADLAGGTPTSLNILDPSQTVEVDPYGNPTRDQLLYPGETFIIPGNFTVLAVDPPTNGILVQIGNRHTWVTQGVVKKV